MIDIRTYGGPKFRSIHTYDLYSFSNAQTSLSNSNMKALVASYGDVIGTTSILSRMFKDSTADFQGFAVSSVVVSGENGGRKWYRDYRSVFIGTLLSFESQQSKEQTNPPMKKLVRVARKKCRWRTLSKPTSFTCAMDNDA